MLTLSWARRPWVCSRRRRNMVRGKLRERWILAVGFVSIFKVSLCKYMCQARTLEYYKQRFRKNLAQLLEEEAGEQDGEVTSPTLNWFYSSNCVTAGALLGSTVARVQNPPQATLCSVRLPQVTNGPVDAISFLAFTTILQLLFLLHLWRALLQSSLSWNSWRYEVKAEIFHFYHCKIIRCLKWTA